MRFQIKGFKMLRWVLFILLPMTAVLVQACAPQVKPERSCNFVQNSQGQRVSWKGNLPVTFYVHDGFPVEYIDAVHGAIEKWERQYDMDLFEFGGWTNGPAEPRQDGENIIYWLPNWEEDRSYEQGRTSIYWIGDKIREADIRINGNSTHFEYFTGSQPVSGQVDMQSLMVHELGHALGLAHKVGGQTVMAATLSNATIRRDVADTDIDSLRCEY